MWGCVNIYRRTARMQKLDNTAHFTIEHACSRAPHCFRTDTRPYVHISGSLFFSVTTVTYFTFSRWNFTAALCNASSKNVWTYFLKTHCWKILWKTAPFSSAIPKMIGLPQFWENPIPPKSRRTKPLANYTKNVPRKILMRESARKRNEKGIRPPAQRVKKPSPYARIKLTICKCYTLVFDSPDKPLFAHLHTFTCEILWGLGVQKKTRKKKG